MTIVGNVYGVFMKDYFGNERPVVMFSTRQLAEDWMGTAYKPEIFRIVEIPLWGATR